MNRSTSPSVDGNGATAVLEPGQELDLDTTATDAVESAEVEVPETVGTNIVVVKFLITGLAPLLQNNPAAMAEQDASKDEVVAGRKKIPSPQEEAKSKVYRLDPKDENSQIYIPTTSFRSALIGACTGRKIQKYAASTIIKGAVFSVDMVAPLYDPTTKQPITTYQIDRRRVVVNRVAAVMRSRPLIPRWACAIEFEIDKDFIPDVRHVVNLLNIAGRIKGVGDFRPECGGEFGRFRVQLAEPVA